MERGETAELEFMKWLNHHRIPFLFFKQDLDTYSKGFKDQFLKRPDFMIFIEDLGFICVDVKYKKPFRKYDEVPIDFKEMMRYVSLSRFNLHVWYVFSNEEYKYKTWFWIPVSKALQYTMEKTFKSKKSGERYVSVPLSEFYQIAEKDSISKLFADHLDNR